MTTSELAKQSGVGVKKLIAKARLLGIEASRVAYLSDDEASLLEAVVHLPDSKVAALVESLAESKRTPARILEALRAEAPLAQSVAVFSAERVARELTRVKTRLSEFTRLSQVHMDRTQRELEAATARLANLESTLSSTLKEVRCLELKTESLEASYWLSAGREAQLWDELRTRLLDLLTRPESSNPSRFPFLDPSRLRDAMARRGISMAIAVAEALSEGLQRGHIVITGSPGTGKTSILRNLAACAAEISGTDLDQDFFTVGPDWTSFDLVGGKRFYGTALGFHPGVFTEAVLDCISHGRPALLLLDEVSRAHPDDLFGGIIEGLSVESQGVTIPDLRLAEPTTTLLPIPSNFRLVCAMNAVDGDFLPDMSEALRRRLFTVDTDSVDTDLEETILRERFERLADTTGKSHGESGKRNLSSYLEATFAIVRGIRIMEASAGRTKSLLGTSYVDEVLQGCLTRSTFEPSVLDELVERWLLPRLTELPPSLRVRISREILSPLSCPNSASALLRAP